jgi:hypothetical protein
MRLQSENSVRSPTSRDYTLATRVTSKELRDIGAAAFARGVTNSHWLRNAAIAYLKQDDTPVRASLELTILTEIMALRLVVLNLYPHAIPGLSLASLHSLMAYADSSKHLEVVKLLARTKEGSVSRT